MRIIETKKLAATGDDIFFLREQMQEITDAYLKCSDTSAAYRASYEKIKELVRFFTLKQGSKRTAVFSKVRFENHDGWELTIFAGTGEEFDSAIHFKRNLVLPS